MRTPSGQQTLFQIRGVPPLGPAVSLSLQHLVAMIVGCVTPPIIIAGAMIVGGIVAVLVGVFVKKIRLLFPPVITGTVVFTIGLSLYPTAINSIQAIGDFTATIVGLSAALGVGVSQASGALGQFPEGFTMIFGKSPVVIATLMAVLLNLILPKEKD